jgi:hypothetical protein
LAAGFGGFRLFCAVLREEQHELVGIHLLAPAAVETLEQFADNCFQLLDLGTQPGVILDELRYLLFGHWRGLNYAMRSSISRANYRC